MAGVRFSFDCPSKYFVTNAFHHQYIGFDNIDCHDVLLEIFSKEKELIEYFC